MMNRTLLTATLLAGSVAFAGLAGFAAFGGVALAQQPGAAIQNAPQQTADAGVLPISDVVNRLSQQGYRDIREVEFDDGVYEVEARAAEGHKIELHVDPRNGGILRTERDDD